MADCCTRGQTNYGTSSGVRKAVVGLYIPWLAVLWLGVTLLVRLGAGGCGVPRTGLTGVLIVGAALHDASLFFLRLVVRQLLALVSGKALFALAKETNFRILLWTTTYQRKSHQRSHGQRSKFQTFHFFLPVLMLGDYSL
ncbi:hypothetical protein D3C73_1248160 [compost metagenome]